MRSRRKRRLTAEINVVPYIDVMLVLLVIFMVTAPLLTTGVNVDLPQAPAKVIDVEKDEAIVLTVTAEGDMSLNVGPEADGNLSSTQVKQIVSQALEDNPEAPVTVRGDGSGSYGNVVRGMVLLQQAGAEQVGLMTDHIDDSADDDRSESSD